MGDASHPTRPRAALVTGAPSGIGRAIAERLTGEGLEVLSVDRAPDPDGPVLPGLPTSAPSENEAAVRQALRRFGRLDIVVANAGGGE